MSNHSSTLITHSGTGRSLLRTGHALSQTGAWLRWLRLTFCFCLFIGAADAAFAGTTVSGHLYVDTNGNGTQNAGEPDLANVDVVVTNSDAGVNTVTTDGSGNWTRSVPAGTTTVDVDETDPDFTALVLAGFMQTEGDDPTTVNAADNVNTDAGNDGWFNPATITGSVLADTDGDTIGDAGISGVVLTLLDQNGDVIDGDSIASGVQPITATTDVTGSYTFSNLLPGTYQISEAQPAGYASVGDRDGGNLNIVGDVDPRVLSPEETDAGNDFIEEQLGAVSGMVFSSAAMPNVSLALFSDPNNDGDPSDGAQVGAAVLTNASGVYTFTNVVPGNYVIVETQPAGYVSVSDGDTIVPGDDLANSSPTDNLIPVGITAGETDDGNTFVESCPAIAVTPAMLPDGVVGTPYSQALTASGGTAPHSFAVTSGALPAGLALSGDTIVGTPTSSVSATFTITATDGIGCTGTRIYTITPVCPTITVTPSALPGATVGAAYSETISATGGNAPYTFAITTGSLPVGLTLTDDTISGASTSAGSVTFTVTATDSLGCTGTRSLTILSTCPSVTVSPVSLPDGIVGTAYSESLSAAGGTAPYTFAVTAGVLPAGLTLTAGTISGTPTASVSKTFTITATDANGCAGMREFILTPACPTIALSSTPASLPAGTIGVAYSGTINASGGTAAYTFAVKPGSSLPPGLTLSAGGAISGTPTTNASTNTIVVATDAYGCQGEATFSINIGCNTLGITPGTLLDGVVGTAYGPVTFNATGGTGAIMWNYSGTLPAGMTFDTGSGVLGGTPTESGLYSISVTGTDTNTCSGSVNLTFSTACPTITVNPATLPNPQIGLAYAETLTVTGGNAPYVYAVTTGILPAGLVLTGDTINGTTTSTTSQTFTITVTDLYGCTGTQSYTVAPACPTITVDPASLPGGVVGASYNQTLVGGGGTAPYDFAVTTGTLPTGLTLSGGVISGTPESPGSHTFTITATDAHGCTGTKSYTITPACPAITLSPATLPNGAVYSAYLATLTATGGAGPYTYAVTSGVLPTGLTLTGDAINGTPTSTTSRTFVITATDATGCARTRSYTITPTAPVITINPATVPNPIVGVPYSQTLTASGGVGPYTFSKTGPMPNGITISPGGILSGTATSSAAKTPTMWAQDANGYWGSRVYTITPVCGGISLSSTPTPLSSGTVGVAYSGTITAGGGTGPYTLAVKSGSSLPPGLSMTTAGVISGTPTANITTNTIIVATDANGCTGEATFTINIGCNTLAVSPATVGNGVVGTAYTPVTFTSTGGTGAITWTQTGALPAGMTFNSSTAVLGGTPTAAGTWNITVIATDANSCAGSVSLTFSTACPTVTVNPVTLPDGVIGTAYSQTLSATGGTAPHTFAVTSGALPAGLALGGAVISGTPTSTTSETFTITATDAHGCSGVSSYTLAPVCPAITVNPTTLPNGVVLAAYSQTLTVSGGTAPHTFAITSGSLPAGLSFSGATISGVPSSPVSATFTVSVTDAYGCTGTRSYTLTPACPAITVDPAALLDGVVGSSYFETIFASGGVAPYTYAVSAGTLPAGLTLSGDVISGTPTSIASQTFTITATDANGCTGAQVYTVAPVCPTVTVDPATLPNGSVGSAYSKAMVGLGGSGPYTFVKSAGTLPAGLTLSSAGLLSGTPSSPTTQTFTVRATDIYGCSGTRSYTMTPFCPAVTIASTPAVLPAGVIKSPYSASFSSGNGVGPYTYSITAGSLPAGLALGTDGVISGSPTGPPGASNFTVRSVDSRGCSGTSVFTIGINCNVLAITPTTVPNGVVGVAYTDVYFSPGGATGAVTWVQSGTLPAGMVFDTANGRLRGTPTETGGYSFSVTATDSYGCSGTVSVSISTACPTITVSPATLAAATVGVAYSQTLTATGSTTAYTYSVIAGILPAGLSLNGNRIEGMPISTTSQTFTIRATDANLCDGSRTYTVTPACPTISMSPGTGPLTQGTVGAAYSQTFSSSGSNGTLVWSVSAGALPFGLSINSATGAITGTPTTATTGTSGTSISIRAMDQFGCSRTRNYTLKICPVLTFPSAMPNALIGVNYSTVGGTIASADGGTGPYTYAFQGSSPAWLTINATTGQLGGTPSTTGTSSFTVRATDVYGCTGTKAYTITKVCPTITMAPAPGALSQGTIGAGYTQTFSSTGSGGILTWSLPGASTLPAGLTISSTTGTISGTPTAPTTGVNGKSFSVKVTDQYGCTITQAYTLKICPVLTFPASMPNAVIGTDYSAIGSTLATAGGGTGPYAYSLSGAPAWLSIHPSTGQLAGLPVTAGSVSFTVNAADAYGCPGSKTYLINVSCPTITMTPAAGPLTQGTVGVAYSQAFTSTGGSGALVWSVSSGVLPSGLAMNSGTGAISGTPTVPTAGASGASISVTATDVNGCAITQAYTLKICPVLTFPASMPGGLVGIDYNTIPSTLATAGGGTGPYTYSLSGAPAWMTIGATTGQLAGVPTAAGSVSFTVNATDVYGCPGSKTYTINIAGLAIGNLVWNDLNNNGVKDGTEVGISGATVKLYSPGSDNAIGGGGSGADVQIGATLTTGATGSYVFNGISPGKYFVQVTAPAGYITSGTPETTDNNVDNNNDGSQPGGLNTAIYSPIIDLAVGTEPVTDGDTNPDTNYTIDFGLFSGIQFGNQVWFDANDNGIKDAGETTGISGRTVEVLDAAGTTVLATATTNASGVYGFIAYTPGSYRIRVTPNATYPLASTIYATTDNAVDNNNDGYQPGGRLAPSTSPVITLTAGGEPGSTGVSNMENTIDFGFRSCPTISITPAALVDGSLGAPYSATVTASGGTAPYSYTITSGSLPGGVSLSSTTGVFSGTPISPGTFTPTVTATDALGCTGSVVVSMTISGVALYDYSDFSGFPAALNRATTTLRLGALVDTDGGNPSNALASGDDTSNTDDEDGIALPVNLVPSVPVTVVIKVTNTTTQATYLNVWVDYNQNGNPDDLNERVLTNRSISPGRTNSDESFVFTPPAGLSAGTIGLRVRHTANSSPGATGTGDLGEVEDYIANICPTLGYAYGTQGQDLYQIDVTTGVASLASTLPTGFASANGTAFASNLGADGVILYTAGSRGTKVGAWDRFTGVNNIAGDLTSFGLPSNTVVNCGDFYNGYFYFVINNTDDLWRATVAGTSGAYTLTSAAKVADMWSNSRGHAYGDIVITPGGILYAHCQKTAGSGGNTVDFFTANLNLATPTATLLGNPSYMHNGITLGLDTKLYGGMGVNTQNKNWYQVSLLNGASTQIRVAAISGLADMTMGACNPSPYLVNNNPFANKDFGDFSLFSSASSTVHPTISLGVNVDNETTISNDANATSDDLTGVDDEDGVTFGQLVQGQTASVTISRINTSGAPAYLNAWIDFDNDGDLGGVGEKVINNIAVSSGTNGSSVYTISIPPDVVPGDVGARFRFTSTSNPDPTGGSGTGEVEDYLITINPSLSIGNLVWNDVNNNGVKDAAESGISGAAVQLFNVGNDNIANSADDIQIGATQTTGAGGDYLFSILPPATYFVKVTPPLGFITAGTPATTDNDVDNNNDGSQPGGIGAPLFSPKIVLTLAGESITDGDADAYTNLTVDFGLFGGIQLGNEVWYDVNGNGVKDVTETGLSGLLVELLNGTTNAVITTTTTNASGQYSFTVYTAGIYKVRVTPAGLYQLSSLSVGSDNATDNNNDGNQPGGTGTPSTSFAFNLTAAGEPGSAGSTDNENTIDFGFLDCPTITLPAIFSTPTVGVAYSASVAATGGVAPHLYTVPAGALPVWATLNPTNGTISGTPNSTAAYSFTIRATDARGCTGTRAYSITPACPVLSMSPLPGGLPEGTVGTPYTQNFSSTGSTGTVTWSLSSGILPPGLSLNGFTGAIAGTPTAATIGASGSSITVRAADQYGCSVTQSYTLKVCPVLTFPSSMPAAVVGVNYNTISFTIATASGGTSPYTYVLSGAPAWMTIDSSTGQLAGVPSVTGNVTFTVTAIDAYGCSGSRSYTIPVRGLSIGNLVWEDLNNDGIKNPTEPGISGAAVQLFRAGADNLANTPDDVQVGPTLPTNATGAYSYSTLSPGRYFVKVTPPAGYMSSGVAAVTDNDVDDNNDGSQLGGIGGPLFSPVVELAIGTESTTDGDTDANTNLTVDFGLYSGLRLGNLVWYDANDNGVKDGAETGLGGVIVELLNGLTDAVITSTTTNASGEYGFVIYSAGTYRVRVTPDPSMPLASTTFVTADNGVDNDNNGEQPGLINTSSTSGIITLEPRTEPGSLGASNVENTIDFGFRPCPTIEITTTPVPLLYGVKNGAYSATLNASGGRAPILFSISAGALPPGITMTDEGVMSGIASVEGTYVFTVRATDAKGCTSDEEMSILVLPPISMGNLVFIDQNGNGRADLGEGVDGVMLELYSSAQTPGVSTPLQTTFSANGGLYLFGGMQPGTYRVHVPAVNFAVGAPLVTTISIAEGLAGDDDVGENGINSDAPEVTGISSGVITVAVGQAPTDLNGETGVNNTSDNDFDAAIDLTVDFGFANPVGVGNVVFVDGNGNGRYDSGEGVSGVTVELYNSNAIPGVGAPLATQVTDQNGHYLFDYLLNGSFFIYIPAAEFNPGGALAGQVSMTGEGSGYSDDNADENGIDDITPVFNGIRSTTFSLGNNTAPTDLTGETGYLASEDNRDDNNYNLTVDFGFRGPDAASVGVGNSVFLDANGNNRFDEGEGVNGVTVKLYASDANPATATPVATTTTANGGYYLFSYIGPGSYFVQIPGSMFAQGAPMYRMLSLPGQGGDNGIDDDQDENGDDPVSPADSGIRSTIFTVAPDSEPTDTSSEFGSNSFIDSTDDDNTDLTIDFGFYRTVGVGNLVFIDGSRNGTYDPGEGVDGVTVEIYHDYQSPGFEPPITSTVTSGGGFYLFTGLLPGYYIVHIPTTNFGPGGALAAFTPLSGQGGDDGNDDDLDENGSDPDQAFAEGVSSLTIQLGIGTEPTDDGTESGAGGPSDNLADFDFDLTVDFGFYAANPASYAQWQAQNPLGGQNGPGLDPDGDGLTNAAEYAFGLPPSNGLNGWAPFEIKLNSNTNQIDAIARTLIAFDDVTVTLQGIDNLATSPAGWFDITSITPAITSNVAGLQTTEYRNLEQLTAFTGGKGFVRLRVVLDTNRDGTPEATTYTDVWTWSRRLLQAQTITYSNPFLKSAVFKGAVTAVTGNSLDVAAAVGGSSIAAAMTGTIPWYIEVISGDNEGHRFEVNEANSTATSIALESTNTLNTLAAIPESLAGDRIVLLPHWTLAEWFPPSKFRATNSSGTADRLGFYTGTTFSYHWLFSNSGNPKWVNDASLVNRGTRVMDPVEGLLIQPRSISAPAFVNLGIVRAHKFACPLKQGTRLIAGGWPMDQSFTSRNMLWANGFTGATSSSRADRIQIWAGDATSGATTYESHYLLKTATLQQWVRVGDSSLGNGNNLSLFKSMRGVYFNSYSGKANYVAPRPWTP